MTNQQEIKRELFPSSTDPQEEVDSLKAELNKMLKDANEKYGFDFGKNQPINSPEGSKNEKRFIWTSIDEKDVPKLYRTPN